MLNARPIAAFRMSLPGVLLFSVTLLSVGGCGAIVRNSVDTQPRVTLSEAAFARPSEVVRGDPVAYVVGEADPDVDVDPDLARFAPVVVQGFQPKGKRPRYNRADDAIGTPIVTADGRGVDIDTAAPAVFARVEHAEANGTSLKQLVYAFWYPRRPIGSIETGDVDGGILRITLDAAGRPGVFEYSQPCGCFHGVFVAEHVEAEARQQFAQVAPDRQYAVEPTLTGRDDWVVRDAVRVEPGRRPVLYMSAGKHFCEAIRFEDPAGGTERRQYDLRPYDALEHVAKAGGGTASMFNEKGLVRGAKRWKEQLVLSDMDNPGWPRHLDKMRIHWDREAWADPHLLAARLRLPQSMTGGVAAAAPPMVAPTPVAAQATTQPSPTVASRRKLILFTNRYCSGCQEVKANVMTAPAVRAALATWEYEVLDTAEAPAAAVAARHRVTVTPVLVALGRDGQELGRNEDIDTPAKVLRMLRQLDSSAPGR